MIYLGATKIGRMFLGSTAIAKAYLGTDLVFQKGAQPQPGPDRPCLTFTSTSTNTLELTCNGTAAPVLYYSLDGTTWTLWDYSAIAFSKLYLYGSNTSGFNTSTADYAQFVIGGNGTVECSGSIATLINGTDTLETIPCTYCFHKLFYGCGKLTKGPALPSTTLKNYCYYQMFQNCDLVEAPVLPATTLAQRCYSNMFRANRNLTTAPDLPATTLVTQCYHYMFYGCTKLAYVKAMFTTTPSTSYTSNWLNNVASSGTFVKNTSASWTTTGVSAVPTGWTIQTASS